MNIFSSILGAIFGTSDNSSEELGALKQQVSALTKSVKTFKIISAVLGIGFLTTLILYLRKK
ncbi:hypothetical protein SAMN04515674_101530 [Pseudarcicella hirudinis]|uniref:Uncharacterized protein n=1 Tax=Pseudarcicella hirudinis TaxID=1079859 RepID=A0A1I5MZS7_9BACT|nr:hypothetical protein [Pseudarcicella hirudinis]SFP15063.1 hypothetical protein SAMN04515674_101530 [Pseudarcicella hirudinis]